MDLTGATWRKSTRSNSNGACVEIAQVADVVAVRDSKDSNGPVLTFSQAAFVSFVKGIKNIS